MVKGNLVNGICAPASIVVYIFHVQATIQGLLSLIYCFYFIDIKDKGTAGSMIYE